MSNVEIRIAREGDLELITAIWIRANAARDDRRVVRDPSDVRTLVQAGLRDPACFTVVALEAERPVGIGRMLPARERDGAGEVIAGLGHISMIAVVPEDWGNGVGRAIATHCIGRAKALGYIAAQLWTGATNERAQRLYAGLGFEPSGREKLDDFGEPIRHFVLRLARASGRGAFREGT